MTGSCFVTVPNPLSLTNASASLLRVGRGIPNRGIPKRKLPLGEIAVKTVNLSQYNTYAEVGTQDDDSRLSAGMLHLMFGVPLAFRGWWVYCQKGRALQATGTRLVMGVYVDNHDTLI